MNQTTVTHNTDRHPPRHVAIIMDGNGRWAKAHGLDRTEGHVAGVETVHNITRQASDMGIKYLSLYTFSTENWNRPQKEVDALMHLVALVIEKETPGLIENNVKVSIFGDTERLPDITRQSLLRSMEQTSHCTGLTLSLALSYLGTDKRNAEYCRQSSRRQNFARTDNRTDHSGKPLNF